MYWNTVRELETIQWNSHLHAFQVKETAHIIILNIVDHHPLHLIKKNNSLYITLYRHINFFIDLYQITRLWLLCTNN